MLKKRISDLASKILSLTFITWLLIFITLVANKEFKGFDMWFYFFTAAVIGLKSFIKLKEGLK